MVFTGYSFSMTTHVHLILRRAQRSETNGTIWFEEIDDDDCPITYLAKDDNGNPMEKKALSITVPPNIPAEHATMHFFLCLDKYQHAKQHENENRQRKESEATKGPKEESSVSAEQGGDNEDDKAEEKEPVVVEWNNHKFSSKDFENVDIKWVRRTPPKLPSRMKLAHC